MARDTGVGEAKHVKKLSNNELVTLDRCEREWAWRYVHGLRAPPSAPQQLGQLVHGGVAELYGGGAEWRVVAKLAGAGLLEQVEGIVAGYKAQWFDGDKPRGLTCVWNEGLVESEFEQAIPDRCVRAADGKLYAMDLKTTKMFTTLAWQRHFAHNQQVALQLDTLSHALGERIEGFWLDVVQLGKASGNARYERYGPIPYSDALREELRRQRDRKRDRIFELRLVPENAETRTESCVRYNTLCPYFGLCCADPQDRAAAVEIKLERGELAQDTSSR